MKSYPNCCEFSSTFYRVSIYSEWVQNHVSCRSNQFFAEGGSFSPGPSGNTRRSLGRRERRPRTEKAGPLSEPYRSREGSSLAAEIWSEAKWGLFTSPGNIWHCLETLLGVTAGGRGVLQARDAARNPSMPKMSPPSIIKDYSVTKCQ